MGEYLQLTPSELKFRFELRKNIPVTLSLHNPGNETIAFKVKTTAPKKYCVRPSSGVVEPTGTKVIQVYTSSNACVVVGCCIPPECLLPIKKFAGVSRPGCVQVIMQAQREVPTNLLDCKDKFLVQSCIVPGDVKDVSGDVFEKAGDTKQTKLRVVLVGPPKPPSPVPEGIEEEVSPARETFSTGGDDQDESTGGGGMTHDHHGDP